MYKTTPRYSTGCLAILFFFISSFAIAQSKKEKESLITADRLYAQKKYDEARMLYLQHGVYLTPEQQHKLGIAYIAMGKDKPENLTEGIKWFEKSARADNTDAMNALSECYNQGIGVSKDTLQGLYWLTQSAGKDNADALFVLGYRYEKGIGVGADPKKATDLYTKSANKGKPEAAYYLGNMQTKESNVSGALYWYTKAANYDYLPAMLKLGEIYEKGTGLGRKDPDEAVRWYTKIDEVKGYTNAHSTARDRKRKIGAVEPPTDISTVKPLLNKLLAGAATSYTGLLSQEKEPLRRDRLDGLLSKSTYYTCIVDIGFKNALIKKEVVEDKTFGEYRTKAGTYYSYSADIVHSVSNEVAKRIFEQWSNLLKAAIPAWQSRRDDDNTLRPSFTISGSMTNGKKVAITLSVYGLDGENVGISISNEK
jgi:TPR repeat protein